MMIVARRRGQLFGLVNQFRQSTVNFSNLAENNVKIINVKTEGDDIDDNYSLLVDQVVNSKKAYRNARPLTVISKLATKNENGKLSVKNIDFFGKETVVEAGDGISHDDFKNSLESTRNYLSSDRELFIEDVGIGAHSSLRVGTRIISDNPAHAFIFRSLLINIPPRVTQHLQRFHGWNMRPSDEPEHDRTWNGTSYDLVPGNATPKKGERPIVAYIGGDNNTIGVQFEQLTSNNAVIAGANIIAGGKASIRGIVNALTIAATALINSENSQVVAIPSLTVTKNGVTTLIVGNVSDNLIAKARSNGTLYGAYANVISSNGISAMFNGAIIPASTLSQPSTFSGFLAKDMYPSVVSNESSVQTVNPDNFTSKPTTVIFVGSETSLDLESAVTKFVQLSDESKREIARSILSSTKIVAITSENDAMSYVV